MTGHPMAVPPRGEPSEIFGLAQLGWRKPAGARQVRTAWLLTTLAPTCIYAGIPHPLVLLAAACVDESDHLAPVNAAGDEEVVSQEEGLGEGEGVAAEKEAAVGKT